MAASDSAGSLVRSGCVVGVCGAFAWRSISAETFFGFLVLDRQLRGGVCFRRGVACGLCEFHPQCMAGRSSEYSGVGACHIGICPLVIKKIP